MEIVIASPQGVEIVIASPQGVAIHGPGLHGLPRFARNDEEKTRNDEHSLNDEK